MRGYVVKIAILCFTVVIYSIFGSAYAESYSFGVYKDGRWKTMVGEVPPPPPRYSMPTSEPTLNQNDKFYLCKLVQLSENECADVQFTSNSSGLTVKGGAVEFGMDVQMYYHGKSCSGAVWKSFQNEKTWVLASPTSMFGFPHECQIP
ncbi:MAG: hypothetical protein ACXVCP_02470 [Bdellovibrio sp.]